MSPMWHVVVVRAWRHGTRRIIRLTVSSAADPVPRSEYVSSGRSAGDLLARWLDEQSADPPAANDIGASTGRTDVDGRAPEDDV